jgi:radical SAM protein with 4Fe4S-binding SPASM domain
VKEEALPQGMHFKKRPLARNGVAMTCYFRTSVCSPYRKALLQITERCNLHCTHCFVSAGNYGDTMHLETIGSVVIPRLKQCRVISVTLTGGEPFAHPDIIEIVRLLRNADLQISICTNATLISLEQMKALSEIGGVLLNVSLDGFRPESHGKFRGNKASFFTTIRTIQALSQYKLLKGLLVTPNTFANIEEYVEICNFAVENGAAYVLTNPLSRFGRGIKSKDKIGTTGGSMQEIRKATSRFGSQVELVNIRFPNDRLPLASCEAGNIIYIFTAGEVTVCPYLVFAAKTPDSMHKPEEFIVGNILLDTDIAERLDAYKFHERYQVGDNQTCKACSLESKCGKGCPAAVISSGQRIGAVDQEVCPIIGSQKE